MAIKTSSSLKTHVAGVLEQLKEASGSVEMINYIGAPASNTLASFAGLRPEKIDCEQRNSIAAVGDYWAIRDDGTMLSYCPTGRKQALAEDGKWARAGRNEIKVGRLIRRVCSEISDTQLEAIVTAFRPYNLKFEIVRGDAIAGVYSTRSLPYSCMVGDESEGFFGIYTENPDVCGMATVIDPSRKSKKNVIARCLVWKTTSGDWAYDRIYAVTGGNYDGRLEKWLESEGYRPLAKRDEVQLENWEFELYPYSDGFQYLNNKGLLNGDAGGVELRCENGGENRVGPRCENCSEACGEDCHIIGNTLYCEGCTSELYYYWSADCYVANDDVMKGGDLILFGGYAAHESDVVEEEEILDSDYSDVRLIKLSDGTIGTTDELLDRYRLSECGRWVAEDSIFEVSESEFTYAYCLPENVIIC